MNNKLPNKLTILLVSALVLSIFVASFFSSKELYWDIKQVGSGEVDVYLKGSLANKVLGADLNISFDKNNLKIVSATPGGFFKDTIIIRSNNNELLYSLMINPDTKTGYDLSKPLFKFYLSPDRLSGYKFCVLPSSLVALNKIGGSRPKTLCRNLK